MGFFVVHRGDSCFVLSDMYVSDAVLFQVFDVERILLIAAGHLVAGLTSHQRQRPDARTPDPRKEDMHTFQYA
ncbi:MAG: hypothetical protein WDN27_02300 [Candidatus Saccharibacteria bacterium]